MLKLRDIMTRDLLTLSPDLSIRAAIQVLLDRRVSGAPVVSAGEVVGVVSASDLLEIAMVASDTEDRPEPREQPDADGDMARTGENEAGGAYYTELWEGEGDVSARFDSSELRELDALDATTVAEAMTRLPVCSLPPTASVEEAAEYMRKAQIHRVLVMTGTELEGIVTATDIAAAVADHRLTARTYVFGAARMFDNRH